MSTLEDTAAYVRFLVVRSMPLLVVDLDAPETDGPAQMDGGLFQTLVERGLAMVPGLYGQSLPQGAQVGLTLDDDELRLEDDQETRLLRVPRDSVDPGWREEALRLRGTMLYVGRNLAMDPDLSTRAVCDLIDAAADHERVAAAIVGVAEPDQGLPVFP